MTTLATSEEASCLIRLLVEIPLCEKIVANCVDT